jgi:hypothetical protein
LEEKSIQSSDAVETVSGRVHWNLLSFISFIKTTEEAITDSTYKAAIFDLILNYGHAAKARGPCAVQTDPGCPKAAE